MKQYKCEECGDIYPWGEMHEHFDNNKLDYENKEELFLHCWAMFDYWMSSDYQGSSDEKFAMMLNGLWQILKKMGRPEENNE